VTDQIPTQPSQPDPSTAPTPGLQSTERERFVICVREAASAGKTLASYRELEDAVGVDREDRPRWQSIVAGAKRDLLAEGIVIRAQVNEGYRILDDAEKATVIGPRFREGVRRKGRKTSRELATVDCRNLTARQRDQWDLERSATHVLTELATNKTLTKLQSSNNSTSSPSMGLDGLLDALRDTNPPRTNKKSPPPADNESSEG